jgi:hypothetical protein
MAEPVVARCPPTRSPKPVCLPLLRRRRRQQHQQQRPTSSSQFLRPTRPASAAVGRFPHSRSSSSRGPSFASTAALSRPSSLCWLVGWLVDAGREGPPPPPHPRLPHPSTTSFPAVLLLLRPPSSVRPSPSSSSMPSFTNRTHKAPHKFLKTLIKWAGGSILLLILIPKFIAKSAAKMPTFEFLFKLLLHF